MSVFKYHVFICCNQRADGRACCEDFGASQARAYMKKRCKELGIHGPGQVRINQAGCLDRCEKGPVMVIYPEETWYTYVDKEDLDEIITRHVLHDAPVKRLMI